MTNYFLATRNHFSLTAPAADATSGLAKGDIVGFNCIPDPETGAPFYKEIDGQYLVNLFYNSQADPTAKNPEEELPIILSDYRSGYGLDIQDYDLTKRYFSSYGCDLRFKDRATLSYSDTNIPIAAKVTSPTSTTANGGWADGANAIDDDWTSNASEANIAANTWSAFLEFNIASMTIMGIGVNAFGASANVNKIDIDVYYNAQWNVLVNEEAFTFNDTATPANNQCKTWYISQAGVTAFRVRLYNDDDVLPRNVYITDAYFLSVGTTTTTSAEAKFNDRHYVSIDRVLSKIHTDGTYANPIAVFPTNISALEPMTISGTDYLFIGNGLSNAYWYSTTAEVIVKSTAADPNKQFFKVVYTTATTMYGNDTNSTIRSTINPLNGGTAWSAATQVDNDADDITSLQAHSGALYIWKENRPYYLSSAGVVQNDLAPECESEASSTSGRIVTEWQGNLFGAIGDQALIEIGTTNTWLSPALQCTNLSDFNGKVTGLAFDGMWLFAALNNTTKVEIMAGRYETIDSVTALNWHAYKELTMDNCHRLFSSTYYQKRLYAIATDGVMSYIPLPTGYGNIISDANRSFPVSASAYYFETPFLHGRFKADTKGWIKVIATLGHSYDADIYWTIQYKKLEDSSYTNIGNLVGTATNRTHTLYLPVDGSSNNPVSTMMRFKLIGVTDTTTTTPVLLGLDFRSVLYAAKKDIIWAKVRVAKEMVTMGGKTIDLYAKMKACLDVCRDGTYPVTMKDIDGTTIQVRFLQLPQNLPWREPVTDEKGKDREFIYNLLLLKTPTS